MFVFYLQTFKLEMKLNMLKTEKTTTVTKLKTHTYVRTKPMNK